MRVWGNDSAAKPATLSPKPRTSTPKRSTLNPSTAVDHAALARRDSTAKHKLHTLDPNPQSAKPRIPPLSSKYDTRETVKAKF